MRSLQEHYIGRYGASDNSVETIPANDPRVIGATEKISPDCDPITRTLLELKTYLSKHMGGGEAQKIALAKIDDLAPKRASSLASGWCSTQKPTAARKRTPRTQPSPQDFPGKPKVAGVQLVTVATAS